MKIIIRGSKLEITGAMEEYAREKLSKLEKYLETDENVKYWSDASYDGSTPTKAADTLYTYTFKWWTPDIVQKVVGDAEYTATFEATRKGSSGGWGRWSSKSSDDKTHGSAEDTAKTPEIVKDSESTLPTDTKDSQTDSKENQNLTVEESDKLPVSEEMIDAYTWAKWKWITTMPTIEAARVDEWITREELAKMMVVYMSKILGKKPVKKNVPKYWDVSVKARWQELYDYTILAYQYQIMWIDAKWNALRYFNPSGKVTRAEFATVFSRVLYGSKYNQKWKYYYKKHIQALQNAWILTNTDPNIKELRWWIMLMLQRSAM